MFRKDQYETQPDKVNTLIGKETSFKGNVRGKGLIRVDGELEGKIINTGNVIIGENGRVAAELKARNITIAGNYEGVLEADGRLELKKTAFVTGSFKVNGLLVEEGAVISGNLEMSSREQKNKTLTGEDMGKKTSEPELKVNN